MGRRIQPPVTTVKVVIAPRGSSLCTGSVILGALAFLICWVPLIGAVGMPLAALGLLMGAFGVIISLMRAGAGMAMGVVGLAICTLSLFVALTVNGAIIHGLRDGRVEPASAEASITEQDQQARVRERWAERRRQSESTGADVAVPAPASDAAPPTEPEAPPADNELGPAPTDQDPPASPPGPSGEPPAADVPTGPAKSEEPAPPVRRRPKAQEGPVHDPPPPAPPAPAIDDDIVIAPNTLTRGDLDLKLRAAVVEQPHLVDVLGGAPTRGQSTALVISLTLTNTSQTRKIDFSSWSTHSLVARNASLTDNFGNTYRLVSYGFGYRVLGQPGDESIHPGKVLGDVIVFEVPLQNIEYLDLKLPAENCGKTGTLHLRIPAGRLTR